VDSLRGDDGENPVGFKSRRLVSDRRQVAAIDVVALAGDAGGGPHGVAALVPEGADCYVSIDVDVPDFSLVPGDALAEQKGARYPDLRDTLRAVVAIAALPSAALTAPALGDLLQEYFGIVDILPPGGGEGRGVALRSLRRLQLVEDQAHRNRHALADRDRLGIAQ
jgi:hypothetical protein